MRHLPLKILFIAQHNTVSVIQSIYRQIIRVQTKHSTLVGHCRLAFNHSIVNVVNFDWSNSEIGWKMAND